VDRRARGLVGSSGVTNGLEHCTKEEKKQKFEKLGSKESARNGIENSERTGCFSSMFLLVVTFSLVLVHSLFLIRCHETRILREHFVAKIFTSRLPNSFRCPPCGARRRTIVDSGGASNQRLMNEFELFSALLPLPFTRFPQLPRTRLPRDQYNLIAI